MLKIDTVAILGCGHGGIALAAKLKQQGIRVLLWSDKNHAGKFDKIKKNGYIELNEDGFKTSVYPDILTTDLSEAILSSDIIYNCTPMHAHQKIFEKITPLLQLNDLKYLLNFSGLFSSIEQYLCLYDKSILNRIKLFDIASFPYVCRADENTVHIYGQKKFTNIASLFAKDNIIIKNNLSSLIPGKINCIENIFRLGLMGTNSVFHPAVVLLHASNIDNGNSFLFYRNAVPKKTARLLESLDLERLTISKKMGYQLLSCVQDDNYYYNTDFVNIYDFCRFSKIHHDIVSPTTLNHRFVTEDVGYGLTALASLANLYHVETPNINSIIQLFSTMMDIDYYKTGRNLDGLTKNMVLEFSC